MLIGYCLTGSFCTIDTSLDIMRQLRERGENILPILSEHILNTDTRFNQAKELRLKIEDICNKTCITDITGSEELGPVIKCDIMCVAPCSSNTLAKLRYGITDNTVTLAVKAHLRNNRPVVLAVCTNDGLGTSANNIGEMLNRRNIFLNPMYQDDYIKKPRSMVSDFSKLIATIDCAINNEQIQPILLPPKPLIY